MHWYTGADLKLSAYATSQAQASHSVVASFCSGSYLPLHTCEHMAGRARLPDAG